MSTKLELLTRAQSALVAQYDDLPKARVVLDHLRRIGVPQAELSLLTSGDYYPEKEFSIVDGAYLDDTDSAIEHGAEAGAVVGGASGIIVGLGSVALPGAGPLLVAGTVLLATIAGMTAGALAGGTIGVLLELGFSREQAENLSTGLDEGRVLVIVEEKSKTEPELLEVLEAYHPRTLVNKGRSHRA